MLFRPRKLSLLLYFMAGEYSGVKSESIDLRWFKAKTQHKTTTKTPPNKSNVQSHIRSSRDLEVQRFNAPWEQWAAHSNKIAFPWTDQKNIQLESWNSKLRRQPIVRSALHMAWISCTAALFGRCSESKPNKSNKVEQKKSKLETRNYVTKLMRFATTPNRDLSNVFCIFLPCLRLQRTACDITRWHICEFSAKISASNTHKWILVWRRLWNALVRWTSWFKVFRLSHLSSEFWVQVRTQLIPCSAMHPEFSQNAQNEGMSKCQGNKGNMFNASAPDVKWLTLAKLRLSQRWLANVKLWSLFRGSQPPTLWRFLSCSRCRNSVSYSP